MRPFIFPLLLCFPVLVFCQVPNAGFENWSIVNGTEQPTGWKTNNVPGSISVTKTTDAYTGNYALNVINNGPSFEGPLPGEAYVTLTSSSIISAVECYVKCDSIMGTGLGWIRMLGYTGAQYQMLGQWMTNVEIHQYTHIQFSLSPVHQYDSLRLYIYGYAAMNPLGFPTGYANFTVDGLQTLVVCDTMIYDTTAVTVFDTTHVVVNDSVNVPVYDTITVTQTIYDTVETTIIDTVTYAVFDTTHFAVPDTFTVVMYDTVSVEDTLLIDVLLTGIPPDDVNTIRVYPNPASDYIYIDNGNYALMGNYTLTITNQLGQTVFQSPINQPQFYLDLNTFGGYGVYMLSILNPQSQVVATGTIVLQ